jgi:hypothetical protein
MNAGRTAPLPAPNRKMFLALGRQTAEMSSLGDRVDLIYQLIYLDKRLRCRFAHIACRISNSDAH